MTIADLRTDPSIILIDGFPDHDRDEIARMYWAAFGAKLGVALGPSATAIEIMGDALEPRAAIVARASSGGILGVAGYKTPETAFASIGFGRLRRHFGLAGALWRGAILSLLEQRSAAGFLQLEGLFVAERARGRGVGSVLLDAVKRKAAGLGYGEVRLNVVDTNPRARQLYEREGFRPVADRNLGPLRHLFGFRSATTMLAASGPTR